MSASVMFLTLLVFAVVLVIMSVKSVTQGMEFTVECFGRYTKTLTPGLNIIMPVIDRIGARMVMMEQVMNVPSQEIITKDNAMVTVDGVVFYQVMDTPKAAYEVRNLDAAILNLTMTNIRTVMGSMDLDELLSKRDEINARLLSVVDEATGPWGIKITRIEIKDISPPKDLVEAMGRQMKAERLKRASILEAEGLRQSEVLRAEGAQQATILEAEGRKEAAHRDADARERLAQAEAKATMMVSEAIAKVNIQAVNYFVAQKYIESLKDIASAGNSKIAFMPLEASNIIGALGGITELVKEAMTKNGQLYDCICIFVLAGAGVCISYSGNAHARIFLHVAGSFRVNNGLDCLVNPSVEFKYPGIYFFLISSSCRHCMAVLRQKIHRRNRPTFA